VTPTPVLDLGYADPPPPADLAERARLGGRRLRRRRRTGVVTAALAVAGVATAGGLAGPLSSGSPAPERVPAAAPPAAALPPAVDDPRVVLSWPDGSTVVVFVTADGERLCAGPRVTEGRLGDGSTCAPVNRGATGFGGTTGTVWGEGDVVLEPGEPTWYLVIGQVRGDVTRVEVTAGGRTVEAPLARSTDRGVGTIYAVRLGPFDGGLRGDIARVAYRGDREVFRCDGNGIC
jgi:hypothetical protein